MRSNVCLQINCKVIHLAAMLLVLMLLAFCLLNFTFTLNVIMHWGFLLIQLTIRLLIHLAAMLMLLMLMTFTLYGKYDLSFAVGVNIFYDNFDYILDDTSVNWPFASHYLICIVFLMIILITLLMLILMTILLMILLLIPMLILFDDTFANTYVNTYL